MKVQRQLIPGDNGLVKYRILGGDTPDGIAWLKVVTGTPEEHEAAHKEMDAVYERMSSDV